MKNNSVGTFSSVLIYLIFLVVCLCVPSTKGENKFDEEPNLNPQNKIENQEDK